MGSQIPQPEPNKVGFILYFDYVVIICAAITPEVFIFYSEYCAYHHFDVAIKITPSGILDLKYHLDFFRNCWQNYVDFYRCTNLRGDDYQPCQYFFKKFTIMCPPQWVERWDEQRDKDAFPVKFQ